MTIIKYENANFAVCKWQGDQKYMTDPNQRSRRHGKPQNSYDIPLKQRANPQQGYYDSNGSFHPVSQPNTNRQASGAARRPRPNSAAQPSRTPAPDMRRRKAAKKKHPVVFLLKAILLIAFCLSAGLFWHYLSTNNWTFLGSTAAAAAVTHAAGTDSEQTVLLPVNTQDVIPNTHLISFSKDTTKPLYGKIIILDPGHGGTDSGCVYPANNPTYNESAINLTIAESTKEALEAKGATVIMLRTDDSWISLYQRIALTHLNCLQYADEFGLNTISSTDKTRLISELSDTIEINSDTIDTGGMGIMVGTGVGSELKLLMDLESNFTNILFLSIHINSNPAASLHGTQVYYVTDESVIKSEDKILEEDSSYQDNPNFPIRQDYYGRDGQRNEMLALSLYESIIDAAPSMESNAPSTVADNYAVLRENNLTGVLIEVGFITNKKDRGYLTDESTIADISGGIAVGCVNFFAENS